MLLQPTNDCYIPHFQPTEFGAHISSYTELLSVSLDYCVTAPQLLNLDEPSHLNAQPTTQIHVAQYHAENGLPNKVVGDFNDNEYKILAINDDNNINDNDNDVYFFFNRQQLKMSIVHIQIALMFVTTKCLRTPTIGFFWTYHNNLNRRMTSHMLVSDSISWRTSNMQ